eukprot:CAMPEP_0203680340 /NCGR_PEP_ID=MMETSP0090-20130426/38868_1 /ASSEMBLY_ACC=CAM_ASM_001088 /TAXON_ID=426623 /ORGANISM="Chaetoceros affinis, Strain CCMP159" /LENGTH=249 /DNA_ID=CAMNT_0050548357 /DNA_START=27 /DNA_END=776 /DNA_ORIENTATION=+
MKILLISSILLSISNCDAFTPSSQPPSLNKIPNVLSEIIPENITKDLTKKALATTLGSFLLLSSNLSPVLPGGEALAGGGSGSRTVGEIAASGIFFKDTLTVESFDDPKVKGVTLYISNFQRPLNERLQKDFFSDPSTASVGCAKTGPVSIADNIAIGKQGEEVFEEKKSLLFKELKVQRIYDKEKNTIVYVSFNTRLNKNDDDNKSRFKSSTCAVSLEEPQQMIAAPAIPVSSTPPSAPVDAKPVEKK